MSSFFISGILLKDVNEKGNGHFGMNMSVYEGELVLQDLLLQFYLLYEFGTCNCKRHVLQLNVADFT